MGRKRRPSCPETAREGRSWAEGQHRDLALGFHRFQCGAGNIILYLDLKIRVKWSNFIGTALIYFSKAKKEGNPRLQQYLKPQVRS